MVERFVARVGKVGAILILAAAILVIGFGGGAVEHFRLAAQTEQQGEQGSGQESSTRQKEGNADSKEGDDSANSKQSQGEDHSSGARQQSGSTNGGQN